MNKLFVTGLVLVLGTGIGIPLALGDDDHGEKEHWSFNQLWQRSSGVAPVENPQYVKECGSCHMAYSPGLLPARSWRKLMAGLESHFGDNAELDARTHAELTDYLVSQSADNSHYRRSRKIMRNLSADEAPLRITELAYFRHEHDEIPGKMVKTNLGVVSLSNCSACHLRAERGSFSEREIRIPGYGRWDD